MRAPLSLWFSRIVGAPRWPRATSVGVAIAILASGAAVPAATRQQQQRPSRPGWPCVGKVDPSYVRVAEGTGGRVMMLSPNEIADAAPLTLAAMGGGDVVFRAGGEADDGEYEFDVPIDTTIESVDFFVSMQCLQRVIVSQPSREELRPGATGVEHHAFQAIRLFSVKAPSPGLWNVRFAGRGVYSVLVTAKSELSLGVSLLENGKPHYGDVRPGQTYRVVASLDGEVRELQFQLVNRSAGVLRPLDLQPDAGGESRRRFAGDIAPPRTAFRVIATGVDARGFPFQRFEQNLQYPAR